jgi:hypothetical protein
VSSHIYQGHVREQRRAFIRLCIADTRLAGLIAYLDITASSSKFIKKTLNQRFVSARDEPCSPRPMIKRRLSASVESVSYSVDLEIPNL